MNVHAKPHADDRAKLFEPDSLLVDCISPSPNFRASEGFLPKFIVLHFTEGKDDDYALALLKNPDHKPTSVSCHYYVDRDAQIHQMIEEQYRAWHTGPSRWGKAGVKHGDRLNPEAIGIEIGNIGDRMVNGTLKPLESLEPMSDEMIEKTARLVRDIAQRHNIPPENIVGHDMISLPPGRKSDPGRGVAKLWERLVEEGLALPRCPIFPYRVTPEETKAKKLLGHWDWDHETFVPR